MEAMRQTWTDDRMDDLVHRMETGFSQARVELEATGEELRRELAGLRKEHKADSRQAEAVLRAELKTLRAGMHAGDEGLRSEIASGQAELREKIHQVDEGLRTDMRALVTRMDDLNGIVAASQRTLALICGGLSAALIAAIATLIATGF